MAAGVSVSDAEIIQALGGDLTVWAHQCHAASVELVRSGLWPEARVARGTCRGVGSQHSWVVLGMDCYARRVKIVDPTLWSYRDDVDGIYLGGPSTFGHRPHGKGNIFAWGKPEAQGGPPVELTPDEPLSRAAMLFLDMLGPLDCSGWAVLSGAPVEGWPAGEIFRAMAQTKGLDQLVPIDILGMVTDLNPSGLYLPLADREVA